MVLSQNYILKITIFDQKYRHQKELSYRYFKEIWHGNGNGMASGQRWQHRKNLDFDFGVHKNRPSRSWWVYRHSVLA